jgi:uncharacterized protein YbjT (DUF2867 family)
MTSLLLVGATGLVGRHALEMALEDSRIARIVAPTRRPLDRHPKLENPLVDFAQLPVDADWWRVTSVVCALGTTQAKAGSTEAFRKVDHDYPLQIAQITREVGAQSFALCSALGANATSRFIYLRTKGQLEDDLGTIGFRSVTILRPGFLEGERNERRPFERITGEILRRLRPVIPARYRLSPAPVVARLLIDGAVANLPGRHIVEASDIADRVPYQGSDDGR